MFKEIQLKAQSFSRLSSLRKLRESLLLAGDSNKSEVDNLSRSIHLYTINECVQMLAGKEGIADESIYEAESELAKCLSISTIV